MPTALFTPETAKAMAHKSWQVRREKAELLPQLSIASVPLKAIVSPEVHKLARAMKLTLDKLCSETLEFKERQALARAYRDLREVWHMVTGEPKPGNRKPAPERSRPTKSSSPLVEE